MEPIKFETDFKLETIFLSLNKDNLTRLNDIINTPELPVTDRASITKYITLVKNTENTPNIELLKREFPDLYFDDATVLKEEELNDYIRMFIANKKNLVIAKTLYDLSRKIKTDGMTEEVLTTLNNITKSDSVSIKYKDISRDIMKIYDSKVINDGIPTGVQAIDEATGGLQAGALTVLFGYTGGGKTTWAINIAYNSIFKANKNVLYLSLEVTKEHIFYDLLCRHSCEPKFNQKILQGDIKRKKLKEKDYNYLNKTIYPDFLESKSKIYVVDETELESYSTFSLMSKFEEIEKLAIAETGRGIELLVIDHAQLLKYTANMSTVGKETSMVNAYVSFFRQQCLNWCKSGKQISVLVLSQASREGWKEADKSNGRYRLTALAEANELERASSLVLSVYCTDTLKQMKSAKVQILKNRDGEVWPEPIETYADFAYYEFGETMNSSNNEDKLELADMSANLFDLSNNEMNELSDLASLDINKLDLDL